MWKNVFIESTGPKKSFRFVYICSNTRCNAFLTI